MGIIAGARELLTAIQRDAAWQEFAGTWCRIVDGQVVEAVHYLREGGDPMGQASVEAWRAEA